MYCCVLLMKTMFRSISPSIINEHFRKKAKKASLSPRVVGSLQHSGLNSKFKLRLVFWNEFSKCQNIHKCLGPIFKTTIKDTLCF